MLASLLAAGLRYVSESNGRCFPVRCIESFVLPLLLYYTPVLLPRATCKRGSGIDDVRVRIKNSFEKSCRGKQAAYKSSRERGGEEESEEGEGVHAPSSTEAVPQPPDGFSGALNTVSVLNAIFSPVPVCSPCGCRLSTECCTA